jgi:glycosyltransferase involved in cell wall biosynthesis
MKICYLADAQNIHIQRWAEYFAKKGYEVHIISFAKFSDRKIKDINLHTLRSFPYQIRIISFMINSGNALIKIKKLIKEISPDILHAHFITDYGFYGAYADFHPFIASAWGSDILILPYKSMAWRFLAKICLKKADLITSVSKHLTDKLLSLGVSKKKIIQFHWGVDINKFNQNVEPIIFKDKQEYTVISTRHLYPIYNIELLLRAVPHVILEIEKVKFLIVGEGPRRKKLMELAKNLGVEGYIRFIGRIPHEELPRYLVSSEVYVSTSLSDSLGVSNLEAMACGCFPILTDIPASRDWIKNGINGFLVPTNEPKKLANAIIDAIKNENLRIAAKIQNWKIVKEKANWEESAKKMEEIYMHACARTNKDEKII